jgi:AmmeMemoRadiSam system protein A
MAELPAEAGPVLVALARYAIAETLGFDVPPVPEADWLEEKAATFVTLTTDKRLRGCIGSLKATRSLADDVRANAVGAGFRDPRFKPMDKHELNRVQIEVSVLTDPEEMTFTSEDDLLSQLRPGIDGVIFATKDARATFLPQVWDDLAHPVEFMSHLKRKAGVRFNYWGPDVRVWRYQVEKFHEDE